MEFFGILSLMTTDLKHKFWEWEKADKRGNRREAGRKEAMA